MSAFFFFILIKKKTNKTKQNKTKNTERKKRKEKKKGRADPETRTTIRLVYIASAVPLRHQANSEGRLQD